MTSLRLIASVAIALFWAVAVFVAAEVQAAWLRLRGLPEIEERWQ